MIALSLLLLAGIALTLAAGHQGPDSVLRHLYLVPTLWAGLTRGALGGGLIGVLAGLLHAPIALASVERMGLTSQTLDGLLSIGLPIVAGLLVGRLVDGSRARAGRLAAVLAIQRRLDDGGGREDPLAAVADELRGALQARRLALLVGADVHTGLLAATPTGTLVDPDSAAAWTLRTGIPVMSVDLRADPRIAATESLDPTPVRALALPLTSGAGVVGVMAVEWTGELSRATRAAAEELALHAGLAVENARLTLRQLHFGEELEEKVAAATGRLRELDRAKTEFLSVVSHELRTPLTALQGFSELLLRSALPPDKARRCLAYIHTEACSLGRIVGELLDLSRIEAGRALEMKPEPVDLDGLMERNVEMFAAEHRQHRFRWTPSPPGVELRADPDALDRMLKNLLSNAVKYSPRGGEVVVGARTISTGQIHGQHPPNLDHTRAHDDLVHQLTQQPAAPFLVQAIEPASRSSTSPTKGALPVLHVTEQAHLHLGLREPLPEAGSLPFVPGKPGLDVLEDQPLDIHVQQPGDPLLQLGELRPQMDGLRLDLDVARPEPGLVVLELLGQQTRLAQDTGDCLPYPILELGRLEPRRGAARPLAAIATPTSIHDPPTRRQLGPRPLAPAGAAPDQALQKEERPRPANEALLVLAEPGLSLGPEGGLNDRRHRDRDPLLLRSDLERAAFACVGPPIVGPSPNVSFGRQQVVDEPVAPLPSARRRDAKPLELARDTPNRAALQRDEPEDQPHGVGRGLVHHETARHRRVARPSVGHDAAGEEPLAGLLALAAAGALADLLALELRDRPDHVQKQATLRAVLGGRGQELDRDARALERLEQHELVAQLAREAIRRVDEYRLKRARANGLAQPIQRRALERGPAIAIVQVLGAGWDRVALGGCQRA